MRRDTHWRAWFRKAGVLCIVTLMSGWAASARADGWVEVRSAHFRMISTRGAAQARSVAADLEQIRRLFVTGIPAPEADPFRPVVVVLVDGDKDFSSWLPQFDRGYRPTGAFFTGRYTHYMIINANDPRQAVYHEYLHLLSELRFGQLPLWLSEGLASFYDGVEFRASRATFGQTRERDLAFLRSLPRLPLEALINRRKNAHTTLDRREIRTVYALSWAVTHYLLLGRNDVAPGATLSDYISLLQSGVDQVTAFERAIGPFNVVRKQLRAHLRQYRFPIPELRLPDAGEAQAFPARNLPVAEVMASRAIVLATCGHRNAAHTIIEQARAVAPGSPAVAVAAGEVYLLAGDEARATAAFTDSIRNSSRSYVPYYYLATMTGRTATAPERQARIRYLRRAIALNPRFVDAYLQLGRLLAKDNQLEAALRQAQHAVALEPTRGETWALLGRVSLRRHDVDGARVAAERGFSWARDKESRHQIKVFRSQLARYEERGS